VPRRSLGRHSPWQGCFDEGIPVVLRVPTVRERKRPPVLAGGLYDDTATFPGGARAVGVVLGRHVRDLDCVSEVVGVRGERGDDGGDGGITRGFGSHSGRSADRESVTEEESRASSGSSAPGVAESISLKPDSSSPAPPVGSDNKLVAELGRQPNLRGEDRMDGVDGVPGLFPKMAELSFGRRVNVRGERVLVLRGESSGDTFRLELRGERIRMEAFVEHGLAARRGENTGLSIRPTCDSAWMLGYDDPQLLSNL